MPICTKCGNTMTTYEFVKNDRIMKRCWVCRDRENGYVKKRYEYIRCSKCNMLKKQDEFINNNRVLKRCKECRDKIRELDNRRRKEYKKAWDKENAAWKNAYNKIYRDVYNEKMRTFIEIFVNDKWVRYRSCAEVARIYKLNATNVNKVVNGKLKSTGGYKIRKVSDKDIKYKDSDGNELSKDAKDILFDKLISEIDEKGTN